MIVTEIEPYTRTKFKVYLDGTFAFVLYKGELSRYGIRKEGEISAGIVEKIETEVVLKRAKLRAMHLLADMDRTEAALREKLKQGCYTQEMIDRAVDYVKSFGYLDDARYAENFVRSRQGTKSRKEIRAALMQKGVSAELAEQAFESCYEDGGEEEAVRSIFRKKRFDPMTAEESEKQRIYGYLARKGFKYETIRQVIQNYEDNA